MFVLYENSMGSQTPANSKLDINVPDDEYMCPDTGLNPNCQLDDLTKHTGYPIQHRMIFVSRGRAGSTPSMQLIGYLYGEEDLEGNEELFGSSTSQEEAMPDPACMMIDYFKKRVENPLASFKWKPYLSSPKFDCVLNLLKTLNITIIYNSRNTIDQLVTSAKHHKAPIEAHCTKVENCVAAATKVTLPDDHLHPDEWEEINSGEATREALLLKLLDRFEGKKYEWVPTLKEHAPRYAEVVYDDLYENYSATPAHDEWMRVMSFLGVDAQQTDTRLSEYKSPTIVTHSAHQSDNIENWEEFYGWVKGTDYEQYVH